MEDNKDTQSELKWIYAVDPSYIPPLLDEYRTEALNENVKRTFFESPELEKDKESALDECGFSLRQAEGSDINVKRIARFLRRAIEVKNKEQDHIIIRSCSLILFQTMGNIYGFCNTCIHIPV